MIVEAASLVGSLLVFRLIGYRMRWRTDVTTETVTSAGDPSELNSLLK